MVKGCKICLEELPTPAHGPLTSWSWPEKAWSRIHLVVDAHSKWPEVIDFHQNTRAYKVTQELKTLFARYEYPTHVVTDNGRQFTNTELRDYFNSTEIRHSFSPPYHSATNGAAKNFDKTFKNKVSKIIKKGEVLEDAINIFLIDYRSIPHCTTGKSPAWLFYQRKMTTKFDMLRPNAKEFVEKKQLSQIVENSGNRTETFGVGNRVMVDKHGKRQV
ncbi:hypothetical protein PUN28_016963 [Cardiocondyla obscurior]|uniref:Integrase catalytic domain-containing protein n=1 Tax=Cardiocondyla obscurior TaxID=286306 RepID=A0AAW2ELA3_9HYME